MRWLFLIMTIGACSGEDKLVADTEFEVTITNDPEQCDTKDGQKTSLSEALTAIWYPPSDIPAQFCGCTDLDGSSCDDEVDLKTESYTYGFIRQDDPVDAVQILLDGEEFAQGMLFTTGDCSLTYQSPVWLESLDGGDVQWNVEVEGAVIDLNGSGETCFPDEAGAYDFLGIEYVTVVGSSNPNYPVGRTVRKVISGQRTGG